MATDDRRRASSRSERTPLLDAEANKQSAPPATPLPLKQLSIVFYLQLVEPIIAATIFPFINQLIRELGITGGDDRKIGYYAGLTESLFFVAEALTVLHWSRLSDRIGRRPVLMIGSSGMIASMTGFGLAKTFWALCVARILCGGLNGNVGVLKSSVADLTDESNMARAFAVLNMTWLTGNTIGPFLGGYLSRPADHWPAVFTSRFWTVYPYFLPCAAASAFALFGLFLNMFFLEETHPVSKKSEGVVDFVQRFVGAKGNDKGSPDSRSDDLSVRTVLTERVAKSVASYMLFALVDIACWCLWPLFFTLPIAIGGLGFSTSRIGMIQGAFGIVNGVLQVIALPRIIAWMGIKRLYVISILSFLPVVLGWPVLNLLARLYGIGHIVWGALLVQLCFASVASMGYGCAFVYVSCSAPRRATGTVNGLAQTSVSVMRAIGPFSATALLSASLANDILGGYFAYVVLALMVVFSTVIISMLPRELWKRNEEESH